MNSRPGSTARWTAFGVDTNICQRACRISQLFAESLKLFAAAASFFDGGNAFPIALKAVVNFRQLGLNFYIKHLKAIEMESQWDSCRQKCKKKILFYKEATERDKLSKVINERRGCF